jgi:hypothetical protein
VNNGTNSSGTNRAVLVSMKQLLANRGPLKMQAKVLPVNLQASGFCVVVCVRCPSLPGGSETAAVMLAKAKAEVTQYAPEVLNASVSSEWGAQDAAGGVLQRMLIVHMPH